MSRLVAGCMMGTSIDGLDAALVEIHSEGLAMSATFICGGSCPLGELGPRLRRIAGQEPVTAGEIASIAREVSLLHADLLVHLAAGGRLDLVCIHGQTIYHNPPLSWQLFNPAPLVHAIRAPLVFDLRAADLAAGGRGAPITPLADWILFRNINLDGTGPHMRCAIVNLGGFINVTLLPPPRMAGTAHAASDATAEIAQIEGGDICACNQLLDRIARTRFNEPYDDGGRHAASGHIHDSALADLLEVLGAQAADGRSLGTGDEAGDWLARWGGAAAPQDLARTACEAVARTLAQRITGCAVLLAGGGIHNRTLCASIEAHCAAPIRTTDDVGIPAPFREAVCFAVLGALCQDKVPITLPRITGGTPLAPPCPPAPLAGCWMYP